MAVEVRRAADRYVTRAPGVESRHSFSFGAHYDPANVGHGLLVACNDDLVAPGAGYPEHPHRGVEIVTWVLSGALAHRDSLGNAGVLGPGTVQRTSAGSGVTHSEVNAGATGLRFVQTWVLAEPAGPPSYAQRPVDLAGGGLVPVAGGPDGAVPLGADAVLYAGRLAPGEAVEMPDAPYVHVYVPRGGTADLAEGDALRLTAAGPVPLVAGAGGAEVLVWATA